MWGKEEGGFTNPRPGGEVQPGDGRELAPLASLDFWNGPRERSMLHLFSLSQMSFVSWWSGERILIAEGLQFPKVGNSR